VVRLKRGGKRFEIAVYPNKVESWRRNIETDLDEVLQANAVFTNVSQGVFAKNKDLQKAFKTTDQDKIARLILEQGELQEGAKERTDKMDQLFKDIATIVAEKCINKETNRPFTVGVITKAMHDIHYSVKLNKSAKQQALQVIKFLQKVLPIERAKMRLLLVVPTPKAEEIKQALTTQNLIAVLEKETKSELEYSVECLIEPKEFREIGQIISNLSEGKGRVEVLVHHVIPDDNAPIISNTKDTNVPIISNTNNDEEFK